ncbi:hypothetical protein [Microvirga calopogonii]|uniref:hypothetical protein n=1 Tax=Microvirga calopogonii TaxID=2078013 RepID=UPI0013B3FDBF|nr:hypothetical protein [Microvirga calopogonii]
MRPGTELPILVIAMMLLPGWALAQGRDAADAYHRMKGREIASRFIGMELTDEIHWAYVFEKGGHLKSVAMGKAGTGTWKVDKDELCLNRPPDEPRCYEVWNSGTKVQLRYEPALPEEGILQKPQKRQ